MVIMQKLELKTEKECQRFFDTIVAIQPDDMEKKKMAAFMMAVDNEDWKKANQFFCYLLNDDQTIDSRLWLYMNHNALMFSLAFCKLNEIKVNRDLV